MDNSSDENKSTTDNTTKKSTSYYFRIRMCPFLLKGNCTKGTSCSFAHSDNELMPMRSLRKTIICRLWQLRECMLTPEECRFSHGKEDLMCLHLFKTTICEDWARDPQLCLRKDRCHKAHGEEERRPRVSKCPTCSMLLADLESGPPSVSGPSPCSTPGVAPAAVLLQSLKELVGPSLDNCLDSENTQSIFPPVAYSSSSNQNNILYNNKNNFLFIGNNITTKNHFSSSVMHHVTSKQDLSPCLQIDDNSFSPLDEKHPRTPIFIDLHRAASLVLSSTSEFFNLTTAINPALLQLKKVDPAETLRSIDEARSMLRSIMENIMGTVNMLHLLSKYARQMLIEQQQQQQQQMYDQKLMSDSKRISTSVYNEGSSKFLPNDPRSHDNNTSTLTDIGTTQMITESSKIKNPNYVNQTMHSNNCFADSESCSGETVISNNNNNKNNNNIGDSHFFNSSYIPKGENATDDDDDILWLLGSRNKRHSDFLSPTTLSNPFEHDDLHHHHTLQHFSNDELLHHKVGNLFLSNPRPDDHHQPSIDDSSNVNSATATSILSYPVYQQQGIYMSNYENISDESAINNKYNIKNNQNKTCHSLIPAPTALTHHNAKTLRELSNNKNSDMTTAYQMHHGPPASNLTTHLSPIQSHALPLPANLPASQIHPPSPNVKNKFNVGTNNLPPQPPPPFQSQHSFSSNDEFYSMNHHQQQQHMQNYHHHHVQEQQQHRNEISLHPLYAPLQYIQEALHEPGGDHQGLNSHLPAIYLGLENQHQHLFQVNNVTTNENSNMMMLMNQHQQQQKHVGINNNSTIRMYHSHGSGGLPHLQSQSLNENAHHHQQIIHHHQQQQQQQQQQQHLTPHVPAPISAPHHNNNNIQNFFNINNNSAMPIHMQSPMIINSRKNPKG